MKTAQTAAPKTAAVKYVVVTREAGKAPIVKATNLTPAAAEKKVDAIIEKHIAAGWTAQAADATSTELYNNLLTLADKTMNVWYSPADAHGYKADAAPAPAAETPEVDESPAARKARAKAAQKAEQAAAVAAEDDGKKKPAAPARKYELVNTVTGAVKALGTEKHCREALRGIDPTDMTVRVQEAPAPAEAPAKKVKTAKAKVEKAEGALAEARTYEKREARRIAIEALAQAVGTVTDFSPKEALTYMEELGKTEPKHPAAVWFGDNSENASQIRFFLRDWRLACEAAGAK